MKNTKHYIVVPIAEAREEYGEKLKEHCRVSPTQVIASWHDKDVGPPGKLKKHASKKKSYDEITAFIADPANGFQNPPAAPSDVVKTTAWVFWRKKGTTPGRRELWLRGAVLRVAEFIGVR